MDYAGLQPGDKNDEASDHRRTVRLKRDASGRCTRIRDGTYTTLVLGR